MEYLETIFEDGSRCEASPENTTEYRETARNLGYGGDVMRCCFEHEVLHTLLAERMGCDVSPVLHDVAHGRMGLVGHAAEEERVLAFQRDWNAARKAFG